MNEETPPVLQHDDRGGVTILTLNRPAKLNALSNDLLAAIMRALDDVEIDPAVRVVVFTGAASKQEPLRLPNRSKIAHQRAGVGPPISRKAATRLRRLQKPMINVRLSR